MIATSFILNTTEYLNMNFVHLLVRLNHFYSCADWGINYTMFLAIDHIEVDS